MVGAGLFTWGLTVRSYVNMAREEEAKRNIPEVERTYTGWLIWPLIVFGFLLMVASVYMIYNGSKCEKVEEGKRA